MNNNDVSEFDEEAFELFDDIEDADDFDDEDDFDDDFDEAELLEEIDVADELDAYDLLPDSLDDFDQFGDWRKKRGGFLGKLFRKRKKKKKKKRRAAPAAARAIAGKQGPREKALSTAAKLEVQGVKPPRAIPWLVKCVSKEQTFCGLTGIFTITDVRRIAYKKTKALLESCRIVAQGSVKKEINNAVCPAAGSDFNILGSTIPAFGYRIAVSNSMLNTRGGVIKATLQFWNATQTGAVSTWTTPDRAYEIYLGGKAEKPDWEVFVLAFDNNAGIGEVARTESARLFVADADATASPIIRDGGTSAPTVFQLEPINLYDLTDRYRK
jgi:hypothetical protein